MDSIETTDHRFILRIWLEEPPEGTRRARWRGHITHVPSGDRLYIEDLDHIIKFIAPYLRDMGVTFGPQDRLCWWFGRLKEGRRLTP